MSETDPAWTVSKVLSWAADDFKSRSFDSPRLDAELLLCRVLGYDRVRLIVDAARPLTPEELAGFRELIQRRRRDEPIAYILGQREFYGLTFRVDSRVLVPRPDTEILVEAALRRTQTADQFGVALDLCTGSGCVAIAFASSRPTWQVWATDLSTDALEVARDNALRLGTARVCFRHGDLYGALDPQLRFDLITANPPYIPSRDIPHLDTNVRDFEPRLALDGGAAGLDTVARVVTGASERLNPGGVLALEIGFDQAARTSELFVRAGLEHVVVDRDYGNRDRVVSGVMPR